MGKIKIQPKSFLKWLVIASICGAHSFYEGVGIKANPWAMCLGILTFVFVYSFIESHPKYQANRIQNPLWAKSIDIGTKIRIGFSLCVLIGLALSKPYNTHAVKSIDVIFTIFASPDFIIGAIAIMLVQFLTGIGLANSLAGSVEQAVIATFPYNYWETFIATYLSTCFTIIIHSIFLLILQSIVLGLIKTTHILLKKQL